jgi:hypothetical protein
LEDTKGVIRIRTSKDRQQNGRMKKDKQRSTKHRNKTEDRVTRTPLKTRGELRCSERVSISCSTSSTRRVNLVTNMEICHEWEKDRKVFTTCGTYPWSFVNTHKYEMPTYLMHNVITFQIFVYPFYFSCWVVLLVWNILTGRAIHA